MGDNCLGFDTHIVQLLTDPVLSVIRLNRFHR